MTRRVNLRSALTLAAVCLALFLAAVGWRQTSERGIAAAVHVPGWAGGFPVSAAGFAALRGEMLETVRIRADQQGIVLRISRPDDRVVECDDLPGVWSGSLSDGREGCRVIGIEGGAL